MATIGHNSGNDRMYAVTFDLDTKVLEEVYPSPSWRNAYTDVRQELRRNGFSWQQGSVYFGDSEIDAVKCVLAVQDLSEKFDWFEPAVRNIRMLRIEENNDLMPIVERGSRRRQNG